MFELWSWNQNLRRELFLSLPSEATQRKALVGTSLQLSFPYCQLPSCWENRIPLTGSRGPSQRWCQRLLSSFSLSVSLLLVSHARRWIPTLFYLLSISSWLPFVFTQSWQIWGLITFTHGSIGESPQGLLQERNIWKEFFLRFGEQQCWSSEVNFMSLGALWIMNKWLSFPWTAA